jgi:hypothetical protein
MTAERCAPAAAWGRQLLVDAFEPGSMGRPLPGYRIVLLDADGQPSNEGELCIDLTARALPLMEGRRGEAWLRSPTIRGGPGHRHLQHAATLTRASG